MTYESRTEARNKMIMLANEIEEERKRKKMDKRREEKERTMRVNYRKFKSSRVTNKISKT